MKLIKAIDINCPNQINHEPLLVLFSSSAIIRNGLLHALESRFTCV